MRIGFLSAMSLLQKDETDRDFSYISIAQKMAETGQADKLKELFSRMVLNGMIRNTDDHGGNHGFLVNNNTISLSPVYDLTPTMKQLGVGTDFYHSMECGNLGRLASLDNYLSSCKKFNLSISDASDIIFEIYKKVSKLEPILINHGVSLKTIERLKPSFCFGHSTESLFLDGLTKATTNMKTKAKKSM